MKFLSLGGDLRTVRLVQMLKEDNHEVYIYGEEKVREDINIVLGPIPFTKDGEKLNTPLSKKEIYIKELFPLLKGKTLIAGPISPKLKEQLKDNKTDIIDIMEIEELVIYNTIATAEGAIEIAITNTEKNIHGSKVLILGFGRVAKTLAYKLKGLSAEVSCATRKREDFAWIETLGYKAENINCLESNLEKYDIIFNTVPQIILTEKQLRCIKEEALIVDLASKPGGVDQEKVKQMGIKYIWALAIPGKIAPYASAKYIKDTIYSVIKNRNIGGKK